MDALVPMASQPTPMASRNWILRRMMLETIRRDPEYNNGDYIKQPHSLKIASVFLASRPLAARSIIKSWRQRGSRQTNWSMHG
jgi:homoserine acetyltransferase